MMTPADAAASPALMTPQAPADAAASQAATVQEDRALTLQELDILKLVQLRSLCSKLLGTRRRLQWPSKAAVIAGLNRHTVRISDLDPEMKECLFK